MQWWPTYPGAAEIAVERIATFLSRKFRVRIFWDPVSEGAVLSSKVAVFVCVLVSWSWSSLQDRGQTRMWNQAHKAYCITHLVVACLDYDRVGVGCFIRLRMESKNSWSDAWREDHCSLIISAWRPGWLLQCVRSLSTTFLWQCVSRSTAYNYYEATGYYNVVLWTLLSALTRRRWQCLCCSLAHLDRWLSTVSGFWLL